MACVHTLGGQWPNHGPIHFTHSLYYLDRDYKHLLCWQTFCSWKWKPLSPFSYLSLCMHVWHACLDVWEHVGMPVHMRACSCEDPRLIPRIIFNSLSHHVQWEGVSQSHPQFPGRDRLPNQYALGSHLCLPSWNCRLAASPTLHLHGFCWSESQSSHLQGKHFHHWAISPAWLLNYIQSYYSCRDIKCICRDHPQVRWQTPKFSTIYIVKITKTRIF